MKYTFSTYWPHYKATVKLGLPILIGQLGIIILGFADTLMVGRYNTDALAAAAFVNNLFTLVTFLLVGYSYGLTPLIGALYSRREYRHAGIIVKNALVSNFLFGGILLLFMGILYFFLDELGQPKELLPLIRPYYIVIYISMFFVIFFNVFRQFADGTTHTAAAMWILLIGNGTNILFNYLLIYGIGPFPEMGLLGAGISTAGSRVLMVLIFIIFLLTSRRYRPYLVGFRTHCLKWKKVWHINKVSLPVALQMGMETGSFTFSAVMVGWISAVSLASYQIIVTIGTLGFMFYYSIGASIAIRIAGYIGLNDKVNVRIAAFSGCHILLIMALCASTIFCTLGGNLIGLFSNDPAVMSLALTLIIPLVAYQFGDAMQICFANALRGTSHVISMMWIAFFSYLIVGIPTGYVLGFPLGWGEIGIFTSFSIGLFLAAILFFKQFMRVSRL